MKNLYLVIVKKTYQVTVTADSSIEARDRALDHVSGKPAPSSHVIECDKEIVRISRMIPAGETLTVEEQSRK